MHSATSSIGDSADMGLGLGGPELTLSEKLKVFKSSGFDPEAFLSTKCGNMSEKVFSFVFHFLESRSAVPQAVLLRMAGYEII